MPSSRAKGLNLTAELIKYRLKHLHLGFLHHHIIRCHSPVSYEREERLSQNIFSVHFEKNEEWRLQEESEIKLIVRIVIIHNSNLYETMRKKFTLSW
jgi:hypothetical protein